MADEKIKVAVLGGGVGAMSAALALTEIDPAGQKYEITVHQLGWRLGGKCASGRNPQYGQRIEEHGLHIWSGCYENAFTLMRIAFKALNRPPGTLATIGDAFKRQNDFTLSSDENGPWAPWSFWFPPDDDPNVFPGADGLWDPDPVLPAIDTMIRRLIALVEDWVARHPILAAPAVAPPAPGDWLWDLPEHVHALVARMCNDLERAGAAALLPAARWAAEKLESGDAAALNFAWPDVAGLLRLALALELDAYELTTGRPDDSEETKTVEAILIGTLVTIGAIDNDCIGQGFHTIDGVDLREFLLQATPDSSKARTEAFLSKTVLMRAFYDYCFAYEAGDRAKPRLSACSAVQALLRLGLTYKGAFFFKATAGFGDTVFTPIYQVLQSRGVKFKFFHNVTELIPSADGKTIDAIKVDEQVELKLKPGVDEYSPLFNVKGIDCWPSEPFWDQLVNGDIYKEQQIDFEAFYSPQPKPFRTLTLKQGQDFDMVVLGISVAALATICKALVDQRRDWADMVANLATVRTQALQFWVDRAWTDLGGPFVAPPDPPEALGPIVTGYTEPLDTYADMSQLLPVEDWPAPGPLSVAYFCGVMNEAAPNDQKVATETAKAEGLAWTTSQLQALWHKAGTGAGFDWSLLHVATPATGEARFDQQYWRANISPSERYVLSLPNTLQHRLEPGKSGYSNLFLAGDWPKAPEVNAGAVEVAVMCGLSAASALSGVKIPIVCANTLYGPLAAPRA